MSEAKKRILDLLSKNKINADEAYRMINALEDGETIHHNTGHDNGGREGTKEGATLVKPKAKYLRVMITPDPENPNIPDHPDKVNVRVPMSLIRAGIKMKSLIPPEAKDKVNNALKDKGLPFDLDSIKNEDIEDLVEALGDMEIDIEGKHGEKVKVYVE